MLSNQFKFSPDAVTVTNVVANLGAITGGTTVGYCSQIFGRRVSIIFISVIGGALLYPYTFTTSHSVMAAAFFEQFCVQGAWGVIPVRLSMDTGKPVILQVRLCFVRLSDLVFVVCRSI